MNDNDTTTLPETPSVYSNKKRFLLWLLLFVVLLIAAVVFCAPRYLRSQQAMSSSDIAQIQQRLTGLENSIREIDSILYDANGNLTVQQPTATKEPASKVNDAHTTNEVARLQSDVVALSSALTALQNEVKESSSHAQHSQQTTQSTLASAIAYIQLRSVAQTNQPFTTELTAMREVSPNDAELQQVLGKIQSLAATGAPTPGELHDDLITLEASASQAIDQHAAQNWWEKFLAEIKGLVSVRKLHGGGLDAFSTMENALGKNDLTTTLDAMKSLPLEAQNVLSDWRGKAEARQNINEALRALAGHFTALAKPHNTQSEP